MAVAVSIELISQALNESTADGVTKLILIGLCNHANSDGLCWPSVSRLATYGNCSERTVQRCLAKLVASGEVAVMRKGGGRSATHYQIMLRERKDLRGDIGVTGDKGVTPEVTQVSPQPRHRCHPNRNITVNEPSLSNTSKNQFDDFWQQYPRRVGKGSARKQFEKALKLVPFDELMAGLVRLNANLPSDPKFIPHPSTWLSQERWTDEPARNQKQSTDTGAGGNQFLTVFSRLQSEGKNQQ